MLNTNGAGHTLSANGNNSAGGGGSSAGVTINGLKNMASTNGSLK
jgi:hypothetical protein